MPMTPGRDDVATLAAIGILAATLAAIAHETLGHGIGCFAVGGHITLLTSIFFRCQGATVWTDAAGPIGNVVAALLALAILAMRRDWRGATRLLLVFLIALNLFWSSGYLIYSGVSNVGDPAFVAHGLGWREVWRVYAIAIGVLLYAISVRIVTSILRDSMPLNGFSASLRHRIGVAYLAGAISAGVAGLLWFKEPWRSAVEGLLALGVAPIGLWPAILRAQRLGSRNPHALPIARSWLWIVTAAIVFLIFALVQARGIGVLS